MRQVLSQGLGGSRISILMAISPAVMQAPGLRPVKGLPNRLIMDEGMNLQIGIFKAAACWHRSLILAFARSGSPIFLPIWAHRCRASARPG